MPLVKCKVELRTNYFVLSEAGNDNANYNDNADIIFTIKDTNLYVSVVIYQQEAIKKYQNFLLNDLKGQFIGKNIKQKVRIKIQQMNIDIFSNQILLESIDYLL